MGDAFDHLWCTAPEKITVPAQFSDPPHKLEAGCGGKSMQPGLLHDRTGNCPVITTHCLQPF